MKYEELKIFSDAEIEELIQKNDDNELRLLPLSVGEYHLDWCFAQNVCVRLLLSSQNDEVRANAALGLAYIARNHRMLNREIVEPLISAEIVKNVQWKERVKEAFEDIRLFLHWN